MTKRSSRRKRKRQLRRRQRLRKMPRRRKRRPKKPEPRPQLRLQSLATARLQRMQSVLLPLLKQLQSIPQLSQRCEPKIVLESRLSKSSSRLMARRLRPRKLRKRQIGRWKRVRSNSKTLRTMLSRHCKRSKLKMLSSDEVKL